MDTLIEEVPEQLKHNFDLFKLDPTEFKVLQELKSRKRSFINPDDPILSPKGKFKRKLPDVYSTNQVMDVMSAFGRQANKNKMSVEEVK